MDLVTPPAHTGSRGLGQGSGLGVAWGEALCPSEPRFPHLSKHPHAQAHMCIPMDLGETVSMWPVLLGVNSVFGLVFSLTLPSGSL